MHFFSRLPRFYPSKADGRRDFSRSFSAHWKAGLADVLGSLRLLDMFLLIVGASKQLSSDDSSSYLGIQTWKIRCSHWNVSAPAEVNHLPRWCWTVFLVCFRRENTQWTLIKYCLCYLLFLRNTSNWWDLLKTWTLGLGKQNNALIAPWIAPQVVSLSSAYLYLYIVWLMCTEADSGK